MTLRDLVQIGAALAGLTPIILVTGLWWLGHRLAAAEARIEAIERHRQASPLPSELSKDIGKVAERVRGLETGLDALQRMVGTLNDYLHTVLEKGLGR